MPVLCRDSESDLKAITELATSVADYWNQYGTKKYPFIVQTSKEAIKKLAEEGDQVLAAFFPEEPGPFKRVATLIILSRLIPLFSLGKNVPTEHFPPLSLMEEELWLPRISCLLINPAFKIINVSVNSTVHKLTEWKSFPSAHSKAEFLLWLEWLRDYDASQLHQSEENLVRRGRMILACSLILEAVYYQGPTRAKICGICDDKVDLSCVTYEGYLWEERKKDIKP